MSSKHQELSNQLFKGILVLDGAMGTMIQKLELTEADYRGGRSGRRHNRNQYL